MARGKRCPVCNEITQHWDHAMTSSLPPDVSVCMQCHVMMFGVPQENLKEVKDEKTGKVKFEFEAKDGE